MARVVVGAGVTGVTGAYALLRRGHEVTVVDRHRYPAMETSFANGGQLSASNAEVWNSWSTILRGAKWLFRKDAPLLINPTPSWHKHSWLSEFATQILRPQIAHAKPAGALALSMSSRRIAEVAVERPTFIGSLPSLTPFGLIPAAGGVIVLDHHGVAVGPVGVTGDTSDNDEACALAGIAAANLVPGA